MQLHSLSKTAHHIALFCAAHSCSQGTRVTSSRVFTRATCGLQDERILSQDTHKVCEEDCSIQNANEYLFESSAEMTAMDSSHLHFTLNQVQFINHHAKAKATTAINREVDSSLRRRRASFILFKTGSNGGS